MNAKMPTINLPAIFAALSGTEFDTEEYREMIAGIVSTRGASKGCLKTAGPKVPLHKTGRRTSGDGTK